MTCRTLSTLMANSRTDIRLVSMLWTRLAMLRWTNSSPGAMPISSLAGTRASEQPIHRYSGACCLASRAKNSGSRSLTDFAQARFRSNRRFSPGSSIPPSSTCGLRPSCHSRRQPLWENHERYATFLGQAGRRNRPADRVFRRLQVWRASGFDGGGHGGDRDRRDCQPCRAAQDPTDVVGDAGGRSCLRLADLGDRPRHVLLHEADHRHGPVRDRADRRLAAWPAIVEAADELRPRARRSGLAETDLALRP